MTSEPLTVEELEPVDAIIQRIVNLLNSRIVYDSRLKCVTWDGESLLNEAEAIKQILESHSRPLWLEAPWISVSERLPEQGVWVLVAHSDGGLFTDVIGEDGKWCDAPWLTTHWTPMPPHPESTPKPSPAKETI